VKYLLDPEIFSEISISKCSFYTFWIECFAKYFSKFFPKHPIRKIFKKKKQEVHEFVRFYEGARRKK